MDEQNLPVLELANEYRGEARSHRRNLGLLVFAVVAFGVLYLIPHADLELRESELIATELSLADRLEHSEASLASLEQARRLLKAYQADLKARSGFLAEEAKEKVRNLNAMLRIAVNPEADEFNVRDMAVQAPRIQQESLKDVVSELQITYGLDDVGIRALTDPSTNEADWRRVADEVLNRVMVDAKSKLRAYAREGARELAEAVRAIEPALPRDLLDVDHLAESIVVPDDSAPVVTATPRTTGGKDRIMDAEFTHIQVPSAELDSQMRVRASDIETATGTVERQRDEVAAEVGRIRLEKADIEAAMEKTASELQGFVLPFGIEWTSTRLTKWFPLLAALLLCYVAATGMRLDRQRRDLRRHLQSLSDGDRRLLTGPRSLRLNALVLVPCSAFVMYLHWAISADGAPAMLAGVGTVCALAALLVTYPLVRSEA